MVAAETEEDCGENFYLIYQLVGHWQPLRQLFQWTCGNENQVILLGNTRVVKVHRDNLSRRQRQLVQRRHVMRKEEKYLMSINGNSHKNSKENTNIC